MELAFNWHKIIYTIEMKEISIFSVRISPVCYIGVIKCNGFIVFLFQLRWSKTLHEPFEMKFGATNNSRPNMAESNKWKRLLGLTFCSIKCQDSSKVSENWKQFIEVRWRFKNPIQFNKSWRLFLLDRFRAETLRENLNRINGRQWP